MRKKLGQQLEADTDGSWLAKQNKKPHKQYKQTNKQCQRKIVGQQVGADTDRGRLAKQKKTKKNNINKQYIKK